jgi:K+/H+ antiporter YhaU regulatory subunit KhtT
MRPSIVTFLSDEFKAAFAKAQIGEFSFIIAALGNSLGVLHRDFVSVTVGIALGTILICTLLGKKAENIFRFFSGKCPKFLVEFGKVYHNLLGEIRENVSKNTFIRLAFRQLLLTVLWFFLLSGTLLTVSWLAALTKSGEVGSILHSILTLLRRLFCLVNRAYVEQLPEEKVFEICSSAFQIFIWASAFLICIPFLIGIIDNLLAIFTNLLRNALNRRTQRDILSNNRMFDVMKAIAVITALFLFSGIFLGFAAKYLPLGIPVILFGAIAVILAISLWKQLSKLNNRLEIAFIESFNDKIETQEQINRKSILARIAAEDPWPIGIHEVILRPNYDVVGKKLSELKLRELTGSTVIAVTRGGLSTYNLSPDLQFFPGDHIILIGTHSQVTSAMGILQKESEEQHPPRDNSQFAIVNFCIGNDGTFADHALEELDLRKKYGLNVVGVQRTNEKIIDLAPSFELRGNDILLLAGTRSAIGVFKEAFPVGVGEI